MVIWSGLKIKRKSIVSVRGVYVIVSSSKFSVLELVESDVEIRIEFLVFKLEIMVSFTKLYRYRLSFYTSLCAKCLDKRLALGS